jgi:putative SOS response-associated peptidase YedK
MCGRFALTVTPEDVEALFGLLEIEGFPPRYNIAPTQPILTVMAGPQPDKGSNLPSRRALLARWGFIPSWLKDTKGFPLLINARSETAAEKAVFRAAMRHRRALVPASGFYEWHRPKDKKAKSQAYWVRPRTGGIAAFGALMETWQAADGSEIDTVAILTTAAPPLFAAIHDRMPLTIAPEHFAEWLDCKTREPREVAHLMQPPQDGYYEAIHVSDLVNKVANTGPEVQQAVEPAVLEARTAPAEPNRSSKKPGQFDLF